MSQKKAVVLVSGGLDSTTVLAIARSEGYACYSMSFDYGQRHRSERAARTLEVGLTGRDLSAILSAYTEPRGYPPYHPAMMVALRVEVKTPMSPIPMNISTVPPCCQCA